MISKIFNNFIGTETILISNSICITRVQIHIFNMSPLYNRVIRNAFAEKPSKLQSDMVYWILLCKYNTRTRCARCRHHTNQWDVKRTPRRAPVSLWIDRISAGRYYTESELSGSYYAHLTQTICTSHTTMRLQHGRLETEIRRSATLATTIWIDVLWKLTFVPL